jgi:hypothetical protein
MYRLCLLTCAVLLSSCGEKAPEEGALRVTVAYDSYTPACVRVEVKDASGHSGKTDIPASQFKTPDTREVRVAVRRQADWDTSLTVTVSSYASTSGSACDGPFVEKHVGGPLPIVPREFTPFDAKLNATDRDEDGWPGGVEWEGGADCDDDNARVHPKAEESCDGNTDYNCNKLVGCQETGCATQACDDGNACTLDDRCSGTGALARCAGTPRSCTSAVMCQESTCNQATGQCELKPMMVGAACMDSDACTMNDICNGQGTCLSGPIPPCPERACFAATGGCVGNGTCAYTVDPTKVNTACTDATRQRQGFCRQGDGACTAFPYKPTNFDPEAVDPADIVDLITTGEVTFNTDTRTWDMDNRVTTSARLKPRVITTDVGGVQAVLLPVSALNLGGTLRFAGSLPIILAVYGDANPSQYIQANSRVVDNIPIRGAGGDHGTCGAATGARGNVTSGEGEGGGGGGHATAGAGGGTGYSGGSSPGGGNAQGVSAPFHLLGGCAGGNGGGTGQMAGGTGGPGGGALQISVARTLTLQTGFSTSGSGGIGGLGKSNVGAGGGGGGGSGGRLVVEAFQLNVGNGARLTANGGGGGEGGTQRNNAEANGNNGASGSVNSSSPAGGGNDGSESGGDGGSGGSRGAQPAVGRNGTRVNMAEGGGGGGGGAVGLIHLRSIQPCTVTAGAIGSPLPSGDCAFP